MTTFITAVSIVIALVLWAAVFQRAGYPVWYTLLLLVPVINLIWLVVFAFREWPIERELARLRVTNGEFTESDIDSLFRHGISLEHQGDRPGATSLFQLVARNATDQETIHLAEKCVHRLLRG